MRPRFVVPASLIAALGLAVLPAVGNAAPKHNHGLTINATPNPIVTGDQVLIYGQLNIDHPGNRLIVLYHRVNPAAHVQRGPSDADQRRRVLRVPPRRWRRDDEPQLVRRSAPARATAVPCTSAWRHRWA